MSWTNEMCLEFLELYKQEPILWNPKYPNAQNRNSVMEAWRRIQTSINLPVSITDLKKKKESLMTSYRSNVKKVLGTGGKYNVQWFAFDIINSFLADIYSPTVKKDDNNISLKDITDDHQYLGNVSTHSTMSNNTDVSTKKIHYLKRKPEEKRETLHATSNGELDECELYTRLLTNKLRRLDEHQRDLAMHEIDNIMFRAKMQSMNSQPHNVSLSTNSVPRKTRSPLFIVTQETEQYDEEDESIQYLDEDPMEESKN